MRHNGSLPAVVFSEYADHYKNDFYGSMYDNEQNYDPQSITAAATRLARCMLSLYHTILLTLTLTLAVALIYSMI